MSVVKNQCHQKKFIFITGGVVSALGKGLLSASLGALLEAQGYKIALVKCDPYLNVDPGTMSPFQHGEVYVTQDGAETDMDLGHYERFTNALLSRHNSITTGQIYENVILKERKGLYLGTTVQVIPHITDEIKARLYKIAQTAEFVIVEIGGTVGDIESLPFIEAIRQMRVDLGHHNTSFVHLTLVPYVASAGEIKSKPTQHSVKALREVGIQPDFLICRSDRALPIELKKKIALFCSVQSDNVITAPDVKIIYELPLLLKKQEFDQKLVSSLELPKQHSKMSAWEDMVSTIKKPNYQVSIAVVGKYVELKDSYQSIHEALVHGGIANKTQVRICYIDSETITQKNVAQKLKDINGVLIPGGFGQRGVQGKITTARYAREKQVPFLGICFGMQIAVIEFARHKCFLPGADSREFSASSASQSTQSKEPCHIIDYTHGQVIDGQKGASMRLGAYPCYLKENSRIRHIYRGQNCIYERHRHRFQFNNQFKDIFEKQGMQVSGMDNQGLAEIIEIADHPWFFGVQFHPEFQSKPLKPHVLFVGFIAAALKKCYTVQTSSSEAVHPFKTDSSKNNSPVLS